MTRAEYEAKYGVKPVISTSTLDTTPAPTRMTRKEYELTYGVKPTGITEPTKAGVVPRVLTDIPSDIAETAKGFVGAARQGAQNITEAFTKEGITVPQRIVGATVAAPSAVVNMGAEAVIGAGKLLTTDEFEKTITAKIGEGVQGLAETGLGKFLADSYNNLPESEKYTLSKIIAPIANVVTSAPITKGASVAAESVVKTVPEITNTLKTTTEAFRSGLDKRALDKVVTELGKVEDKYKPIRKANLYDKDIVGSRTRIAQSGVLENAVDSSGTLRTQDAVAAYKTMPITKDGLSLKDVEDVVRKNLENENKTINLNELRRELEIALTNTKGLEGADLTAALRGVEKELKGLAVRADELGNVPLVKIQDAKISTTSNIDFNTPPQTKTYRKAIARVYKEIIESKSDLDVKSVNQELSKYYRDIERLERLDGSKVEGGRLGKYTAALTGTAIGMGAGSVGGGLGSAVGGIVGGEIGALLKGRAMSQTFRGGGQGVPENAILQQAQARANAGKKINLKVADKKVGAPKNVPKTKEIQKIEGQINRNVEMQKKAIKAGDFELVAKLKEIYVALIEKLKEQVRFVRENIKSESGKLDLFGRGDGQSIPRNLSQRNTTTPAKTNSISKTVPEVNQSVKADVEDSMVTENLMRLEATDVKKAEDIGLFLSLQRRAEKGPLSEEDLLDAQRIVEEADGKLPEADMSTTKLADDTLNKSLLEEAKKYKSAEAKLLKTGFENEPYISVNKYDSLETAKNKMAEQLRRDFPDGIELYHMTTSGVDQKIIASGFKGGKDVYFSAVRPVADRVDEFGNELPGLVKVTISPKDYKKIFPDELSFEGENSQETIANFLRNGAEEADITIPKSLANQLVQEQYK